MGNALLWVGVIGLGVIGVLLLQSRIRKRPLYFLKEIFAIAMYQAPLLLLLQFLIKQIICRFLESRINHYLSSLIFLRLVT